MEREIDESIQSANREKVVERGGVMGEGSFGQPGWQRTYPTNADDSPIEKKNTK